MSKIVIIDVDLEFDIESIIAESAEELTAKSREDLDVALAVAESAKRIKEEKAKEKEVQTSGLTEVMDKAYDTLVQAGEKGVSQEEIMEIVGQYVSTTSAFSIRMNNILSTKGNPYRLLKNKSKGAAKYIFIEYNSSSES